MTTRGNPTKYRAEYCQRIVETMSEGKSLVQFAVSIGVSRDSIYEWEKVHPEFKLACKAAKEAAQSWWEDLLMKAAQSTSKSFNITAIIFSMKNRFKNDYGDYDPMSDKEPTRIFMAYDINKRLSGDKRNEQAKASSPTGTENNLQG